MTKRVAITGYSFRFPSTDMSRYWQDLVEGRDLVTEVDSGRWPQETFLHPDRKHPGTSYTFAAGSIGDISMFDAAFFGISPREAAQMDPQQRLLLEMSWEALENSGIVPSSISGSRCGVFVGLASADYSYRLADDLTAIDSSIATGNTASIAANRISYILNLTGPSMALDTACSSSLVAFHQACQSILSGESTQAFAGGISLHLHPYGFISFSKASMLSPRGRCRVFDASGDGYVRSEGGGIFFLKDYDQALRDGNPILAVVAKSAINTDGRKSGLTVPNPKAQIALLEQAYTQAGIDPKDIDYLEAHGTGTAVGDPIEALAIGTALGKKRPGDKPLPIGSVKSNVGHLETASGVAGLVKALYCLEHRQVPATIGFENPNPDINFRELNIKVVTQNLSLKKSGKLVIGINSFGFGGANAHVILEGHPLPKLRALKNSQNTALPIILSAKTSDALKSAARDFSDFLTQQSQADLYDIAYNAAFRREWHDHRLITYGTSTKNIAKELASYAKDTLENSLLETGVTLRKPRGPAFVYSGNGSQWSGMGGQLFNEEPIFRETIQEIDVIFRRHANFSLAEELTGKSGEARYEYTEIAQPALFAVQVGITEMLRSRGLKPVAVAGHSVGEIAAAWASGALTLEAAIEVIYHRSRLQGATKGKGAMTAVGLGQEEALKLIADLDLGSTLAIAGVNSSRGVTVAGSPDALSQLETTLATHEIFYKRLDIDYAFHSPVMDEIEKSIKKALAPLQPRTSLVPFYSSVTGNLIEGENLNAEYWWNNIRKPVLFEQATKSILAAGTNIFIEIGPRSVLRSYINTSMKDSGAKGRIFTTATEGENSPRRIWRACSQAVISGTDVDWQNIFKSPGKYIHLPNYPWQRERYWHNVTPESIGLLDRQKVHALLGYPLRQQELTWENRLDTKLYPFLADHTLGDAHVFPGTGFSELALAAAFAWQDGVVAEIEGLEIHSPLLLSGDHTRVIRLNIVARDGSMSIKGREHCSSDSWVRHAVARILAEPQEKPLHRECPILPARQPDFTFSSHAMLTRKAGLSYGPAFQCIDYGWLEGNAALGVFAIPKSIENNTEDYYLHPAILDCTFQLIIQLLREDVAEYEGMAFVPTRMGRISFRRDRARPAFAEATLLRRSPHSLTAEFTVFDSDGLAVAVVKDARFRSVRLTKKAADHLRFLHYRGIPKPHILNPDQTPFIAFKSVQCAFVKLARGADLERSRRRYTEELDPLLDMLCNQFIREALQQVSEDGQRLSSQQISTYRTANPEIAPFIDHLLSQAEEDQSILRTPNGWEILPDSPEQPSAQDIWNSLVTDYPDFFGLIHAVGRMGMHLKSILEGSLTPAQIHSPDQTIAKLTGQILGAVARQKGGLALRDLIAQGIKQLPEGRRLGIIEISDGPPSFALDACVAMNPRCCDYIFASMSAEALESAAPLKERFGCMDLRLLTTTSEASETHPPCQLAIVTLNFSTPEESVAALNHARASLTQGGSLIILGLHPSRWIDFVFGVNRTHWSPSKDQSLLSNQLPALFWKEQLQQLGFSGTSLLEFSAEAVSGPYVLLAQPAESAGTAISSHRTTPRSWLLLADQRGLSAQLSNALVHCKT